MQNEEMKVFEEGGKDHYWKSFWNSDL